MIRLDHSIKVAYRPSLTYPDCFTHVKGDHINFILGNNTEAKETYMKTILITGATSGIGRATVLSLVSLGHRLIFIARNSEKAENVKNGIITSTGKNDVNYILADLSSKRQVRECAETFRKNYETLDILINNAGVCLPERRITTDGMEESFQINHLSHFMLSNLLTDLLKRSDDPRIINVSSAAYESGVFDPENLQSEKVFKPFGTYCNTKLLNLLFTYELADRLNNDGITVNALHPGVVGTGFGNEFKGLFRVLLKIGKPFLLSPEKGAITSVYLATSDEVIKVTGKYFVKCKPVETKNRYINPENRRILWEKSMQLSEL